MKHDSAKVMELQRVSGGFKNGLGEIVELELDFLYPMLKSSNVAKEKFPIPQKWMLVTQKKVGQKTEHISEKAPNTWQYLETHGLYFDRRKSSLYKNRPRFSVFGVGDYSFAPWKIAISGLYKKLSFAIVAPYENKPVVLDDTCYSIPCSSKKEAELLYQILSSKQAYEFYNAFIFWDSKRPIKVEVLNQLDLEKISKELNIWNELEEFIMINNQPFTLGLC